jgi:general L-amino acid transport system substrate-binding protein
MAIADAVAAAAITYVRYDTRTLKRVVNRGQLLCGVNPGLPGFSTPDDKGNWSGFDVDFCRAISAAIFNDASKVKFVPLDASTRFTELRDRNIDVLSRNSTWSISRETEYGLHFAGVSYYDGQGFMTKKARNIDTALGLDGSKVCVQANTTTELNLTDYFKSNHMSFEVMKFNKLEELLKAYEDGKCDTITSDMSQLYAQRLKLAKAPDSIILPDVISKEPLAPVVRHRDDQWLMIVKWTLFAMLNAEELGITSKNVDEAMRSGKPEVQRFLGIQSNYGDDIGLTRDWAARIIRHVGNYGEVYDRNVGDGSKLAIPRGLNQLWDAGGIQYAPPIR